MKVIIDWGTEKLADGAQAIVLGLLKGAVKVSYWPCVIICISGTLFYLVGIKKGGKYASGSMLTYLILQCLKLAMK